MSDRLEIQVLAVRAEVLLEQYRQAVEEARKLEGLSDSFRCQVQALEAAGQETGQVLALQAQQQKAMQGAREMNVKARGILARANALSVKAYEML